MPFTVVKEQMLRKKKRMLFEGCVECEMKTGIWEVCEADITESG